MSAPAPGPASPTTEPDRATRWVTATKDSRDAIKWLATAIGASAAVAFGAGPVLASTSLDTAAWPAWRTALYIISALVGAVGVAYIVWTLLKALVPRPVTLDELPATTVAELDGSPEVYYPGDIDDFQEFVQRFAAYRDAAIGFRYDAALEPPGPDRDELTALAIQAEENLRTLRRAENVILEKAGFDMTRGAILDLRWPVLAGVCVTILGVAVFQLTISGSPAAPEGTAEPVQAVIVRVATDESRLLWDTLDLEDCELSEGRVAVMIASGVGTSSDPYDVTTISVRDECPSISFTVSPEAALVIVPEGVDDE